MKKDKTPKLVASKDKEKKTTFTVLEVIEIDNALRKASEDKIEDDEANYGFARNLKKCKSIVDDYGQEQLIVFETFAVKDKKGNVARNGKGVPITDPTKLNEVKQKLEELQKKTVEVDFHLVERSGATDRINSVALSVLLDVIIVEK